MTEKAQLPEVFVDFHNADRQGRIRLNTAGTIRDLNQLGVKLHEGLELLVSCFELEAEAIATYSSDESLWVAVIDWNKIRSHPGDSCE